MIRLIFTNMFQVKRFLIASGLFFMVLSSAFSQSIGYMENKGQWDEAFIARYTLANGVAWFMNDRVRIPLVDDQLLLEAIEHAHDFPEQDLWLPGHSYEMRFSSLDPAAEKIGRHQDYVNFYLGNDPSKWAGRVGIFDELYYREVQPNIDLQWSMQNGHMKYTFIVAPYADPADLFVEYAAIRALAVNEGMLEIKLPNLTVVEQAPYAFQMIDGEEVAVDCGFDVDGFTVTYDLGNYNRDYPLYIDPVVVASTNVGATVSTFGHSATFDQFGNIYGGGRPFGQGYPVDSGSFQMNFSGGGVDIGISKLNDDGSQLLWSSYIGGSAGEYVHSIVVNGFNDVIVYGQTMSTNYPTSTNAFDDTYNGGVDICVTVLSDSGDQLVGSTYLGGDGNDGSNAIPGISYQNYKGEVVCDIYSNVYIASTTTSDSFPVTQNAYQTQIAGGQDGIITKLNYDLSALVFSTYLGGDLNDGVFNLKPAKDGTLYAVGVTASPAFPVTTGAEDETYNGGQTDAFIVRLSENGSTLLQSTFVRSDSASNDADKGLFLQIDRDGAIYILGTTNGGIVADTNRYLAPGNNQGSFIRKYTKELDSIYWTTTFANLSQSAFLVDNCKNIYAAGNGSSANGNFELTTNAVQPNSGGFYVIVLNSEADSLIHGTFYGNGGSHVDGGTSRFDKRGAVYQATCSNGFFPLNTNAYSGNQNGGTYDLTLFKIDFEVQAAVANAQISPNSVGCAPFTVDFTNFGSEGLSHFWDFGDGDTALTQTPSHTFTEPGVYEVIYVIFDTVGCVLSDTAILVVTVIDPNGVDIITDSAICTDRVVLTSSSGFSAYTWSTGETTPSIEVTTSGSYWLQIVNICGFFLDTLEVDIIPPFQFTLINDTGICEPGFEINGPAGATFYNWNTGDTTQATTTDTTGNYILIAGTEFCSDTDTVNIRVSYVNFSAGDTVICGNTLQLDVTSQEGTITWSTGDTTESIIVSQNGTYWVLLQNGYCSVVDTIHVGFNPTLIDLGADTVICSPAFFSAFDSNLVSYEWSTGDTTPQIFVDSTTTVWLIGRNELCADTDTLSIEVQYLNFTSTEALFCDADSASLFAPGPIGSSFLWSNGDTTRRATVEGTGTYYVTISTDYCSQVDSLRAVFASSPDFTLGDDRLICRGQAFTLEVDSLWSSVRWNTGDTSRSIVVNDSGLYIASMSFAGCEALDSVHVDWRSMAFDSLFIVPNVITPNSDGINDVLGINIQDISLIIDYKLVVFNRWGVPMFESMVINHDWDGTAPSGDPVEPGVYFYILTANTVCTDVPTIEVKDNVTVIR